MEKKLYLTGPCYCKYNQGDPERNEIMCITNTNSGFEQIDLCEDDEGCIGPKNSDEAGAYSAMSFCSKGASTLLYYKPISGLKHRLAIVLFSS